MSSPNRKRSTRTVIVAATGGSNLPGGDRFTQIHGSRRASSRGTSGSPPKVALATGSTAVGATMTYP